MNLKRFCVFAAVVGSLTLAPRGVSASPVEWFKFGPLDAVNVVNITYGSFHGLPVYAGQYGGTIAATQAGLSSPSATHIYTFCIDLNDEVALGQQYEVAPTSTNVGLTNGSKIAYLYGTYGTTLISGSNVNGSGLNAADYAEALQLAIWDELVNNGHAPTVGSALHYSGESAAVDTQVQHFLTEASTNAAVGQWLNSNITQPPGVAVGQSFLDSSVVITHVRVPEPATVTLLGTAVCCAIGVRYTRRRRPETAA